MYGGVPFYQRWFLRFFVGPFIAKRTPWAVSEQNFHKISGRLLKEIENLSEKQLTTKILVPPQMGLEDSSRFWSIAMALEHMVIVGEAIMSGVTLLASHQSPPIKVDLAAVKPVGLMPYEESVSEFKFFISDDYKKFLLEIQDRNSTSTLAHPWFGPFNAQQWFWLLSMHQAIHLKQIREIKKRLPIF